MDRFHDEKIAVSLFVNSQHYLTNSLSIHPFYHNVSSCYRNFLPVVTKWIVTSRMGMMR